MRVVQDYRVLNRNAGTRLAAIVMIVLASTHANAELRLQFDDHFDREEREKLSLWVHEAKAGVESLVGPYPFDIRIRFTRARSGKPVPWARTYRGRTQGIHFYVDPRHSLDGLRRDWTAAHEFSHLILPYLGRQNSWFAEGFASFMQYQVMHSMGVIGPDEVIRRYRQKLDKSASEYGYPRREFVATTPRLQAERRYPVMYWGAAVFFFRFNQTLETHAGITVIELLSDYMRCCRRHRSNLPGLARELDELAGAPYFSESVASFVSIVGFPDYGDLRLGIVAARAD